MKILVVSQYFYPENLRINDICFELSKMGHKISVLTAKPNYPIGSFFKGYNFFNKNLEKINDINIFRSLIIPRGKGSSINLFLNYTSFIFFGLARMIFIKERFDRILVYAPSPITVGFVGFFCSIFFKAKAYIWVHDLWPESVKYAGGIRNNFLLKIIEGMTMLIYRLHHKILTQSPDFIPHLISKGVKKEKLIYYPYYAESFYKKIKPNNEIKNFFPSGLNILFAGNIGVAQSFDTIVSTVEILDKKIRNFSIIVLGNGRDKKRIFNIISKKSLEHRFKFLGSYPASEMPKFFSCADALLVSLKKSEIFEITIPGKLQSYLACGKPIIGSIDGITAKIINENKCGYSAPAENANLLAKSILKFNSLNKKERLKMGINSLECYNREFERDKLLNKLIHIFRE